jgi:hypothetical protein
MKVVASLFKILIGGTAICLFQALAAAIVPIKVQMPPHTTPWLLAANFVTAGVLVLIALRSDWKGWRLGVAISAIPITLGVTNVTEVAIFPITTGIDWSRIIAHTVIVYEFCVPVWILLFAKSDERGRDQVDFKLPEEGLWRFLVSDVSYVVLYYIAGMIVFPYVRNFYAPEMLPPVSRLVAMQLLVRGPILVGLCLVLLRSLRLPRVSAALAVGAALALLNGVAPLLVPNPYLPDAVRWAHLCEIASSNFVFGVIVGWLWGRPSAAMVLNQSLNADEPPPKISANQ